MHVTTFHKHMTDDEKELFEDYLHKKLDKFEQFLTHFDDDAVKLNVTVEKFAAKEAFKVEMFMEVPKASKKSLHSHEDSRDIRKAIDSAKKKLIDQLKRAIEKMQHEHEHAA